MWLGVVKCCVRCDMERCSCSALAAAATTAPPGEETQYQAPSSLPFTQLAEMKSASTEHVKPHSFTAVKGSPPCLMLAVITLAIKNAI